MNRILLSCIALVALLSAGQAWAGPLGGGLPKTPKTPDTKVPGGGGGGGATVKDVDAFIASAIVSEVLVRKSSVQLGRAVLAKEIMDPLEQRRAAAEKMTDGKEKDAALRKVDTDRNAALAKVDYQKVSNEEVSKWDDVKKSNVRDSLFNLSLAVLVDTELVASGRKLASGAPAPEVATRIPLVNETVSALNGQVVGLGKITSSAKVLGTAVKLDKLPTSASETPREINL
jgi:hypothetical protein